MKTLLACTGLLIAAATISAQTPAPKPPPKSPAATASVTIAGKAITVTYSSPRVNGRAGQIFSKDGLIGKDPSYPIWRAGANAATVLHTDADLVIGDLPVAKGDYSLWVDISNPDAWVLIVNKQSGQWGRTYNKDLDAGHVKMTMFKPASTVEDLTYTLAASGSSKGTLTLSWENHTAVVPFTVK